MKKLIALCISLVILATPVIAEVNQESYQNLIIKSPIEFETFNTQRITVHSMQVKSYETGIVKIVLIYEVTWQNGEHEAITRVIELKPGYDYYNESVVDGKVY